MRAEREHLWPAVPKNTTSAEVVSTPVGCFLFKPLGPLFGISLTALPWWIAVRCVPVHGLFLQIHIGVGSIGPTVQTCSTQSGLCHRGGLRTGCLLVFGLSVSWLTPLIGWQDHSGKWCTENGTPPGNTSPERASECVLRLRLCLPVGRGIAMVTPVPFWFYLRGNSRFPYR